MTLAAGCLKPPPKPAPVLPRRDYIESVGGCVIRHHDRASFVVAYKDIFRQRIYHFESSSPEPFIIDGGACIGLASLYFKRAYPNARVLAFEPDAALCELFRKNMSANGVRGVELVRAALSDESGEAGFVSDGADGGRIITAPDVVTRVSCVALSDYLRAPVDFLKLNIEGQESRVLRELEASGKLALVREMVVEYHGRPDDAQSLGELLSLLERNGYRYLVHDFDRQTGPTSKPPFRLRDAPWYCLIYAKAMSDGASRPARRRVDLPTQPVSRVFGLDRGTPIDRHYIEGFLERHRADIRGRVLEVGDATYARRFGGARVQGIDVLHATEGNRHATIVGDLHTGEGIPRSAFDCILLTQTLNVTFNVAKAVDTCYRALKPGGVLLATVPGISQISRYDADRWGDYWRVTPQSSRRLFEDVFGAGHVRVESHGNVGAAVAFLVGWSVEEIGEDALNVPDEDYPVTLTIRAERVTEPV
jgi:FkbM family methyltransferase